MLNSIAYLMLMGLTLGFIFTKLRLPALLGMLISGIVLGPYGLDMLDASLLNISAELRQIALVIILLRAGLSLDIADLKQVGRPAVLLCFVPALFEIGGVVIIATTLLGVSIIEAFIIGSVLAAVSPAVIVPKMINLIEQKKGTDKSIPQMIMAAGSVDDVFVIVLFTAATALGMGNELSGDSFTQIPVSIVFGLALGVVVGVILDFIFKAIHLRDTIKILIILSVSFLLLGLEQYLKDTVAISALLAIMTMGICLRKIYTKLAKRISSKFNKLWVGAEVMLFVLVGATVDINYATSAGIVSICVILFALIFRMSGVFLSVSGTNLNVKEKLFCMIAYTPKATVQAAIGSIPLAMGLPCGDIVLTIAVLSILITAPLGALAIDSTQNKLLS